MLPQGLYFLNDAQRTGLSWFNLALGLSISGARRDSSNIQQGSVLYLALEDKVRPFGRPKAGDTLSEHDALAHLKALTDTYNLAILLLSHSAKTHAGKARTGIASMLDCLDGFLTLKPGDEEREVVLTGSGKNLLQDIHLSAVFQNGSWLLSKESRIRPLAFPGQTPLRNLQQDTYMPAEQVLSRLEEIVVEAGLRREA